MGESTNAPFHVSRFTFHIPRLLMLILLMIVPKFVWGQPQDITVVQIQYRLDSEIVEASPLLADLQRRTKVESGDVFSHYHTRKSIEGIYAIGSFSWVAAILTPVQVALNPDAIGEDVRLTFQLISKTRVGKIEFTGTHLDKDLLLEAIKSRSGKEYSVDIARADRRRILDLCADYAYFQATAHLTTSPAPNAHEVELLYTINEGGRARIQDIRFEGAKSLERKRLDKALRSKPGKVYQKRSVEDDIRHIRELYRKNGYLAVKVEHRLAYDDESGTVALRYKIIEGKKVKVEFVGDGIDRSELRKNLVLFKRDSYSDTILDSTAGQIYRLYQQKGYYAPKVNYRIERESNREVVIRFDIELGQAPRIRHISFEGNAAFDDSVLLDQMETQPRSRLILPGFGWLFSQGVFNPAVFDTDRRALDLFYRKVGYPEVRITTDKKIDEGNELILYVKINEGKQRLINHISIEGNEIFETGQLRPKLAAKPGRPYSKDIVGRDLRYLQSRYDQKGYIYANIEPRYQQETGTLTYRISEGTQAKFGRFYFDGDGTVKLNVLRQEFENLGLYEGAVFNHDKLFVESRQRLLTYGLFREIDIKAPEQLEGKEIIDVDVGVKARKPGSISVSGGYIASEGFRGTVGVTHSNLFRRTMRATGQISAGTRGNLYDVTLIEPWLKLPLIEQLVGYTIGTFRLFEDNLEERDDIRARGGTANLAKRLGRFSHLAMQYKYQELRQSSGPDTTVSSLGIEFHRDNRDHFLNPKNGWLNEIAIEYAGGFLGGQTSFYKITTDHRYHRQIWGDTVLASAIRLGFEEGLRGNKDREIISFERFYAGGSTTVRGYKERSFGAADESENLRGDVLLIFNTELRFPIYKFIGGVLFFDTGNVWDKFAEIDNSLLNSAAGLGVRLDTPLGPARFDFGVPLRKGFADFGEPQRGRFEPLIYLELGQAF